MLHRLAYISCIKAEKMKRGAEDLLDTYHGSRSDIAEAYIRGDLSKHLALFVWAVVTDTQIASARE